MAHSLLCATVTGPTMAALTAARDEAHGVDLVELRLDGVDHADVAGALHGRRVPVIVTCRPIWEGGRFDGSETERIRLLRQAIELGAEYVDLEWRALQGVSADAEAAARLVRTDAARIVLSSHEFGGWPDDLVERARAMRATGAGTIKVAAAAARLSDTLELCGIAREGQAVVVGMGPAGVPTRLLATRYGSAWTYAGEGVAPGQVPVARMIGEFRFRRIGGATRLFGVVGAAALHSASPAMHNAAFEATGIDGAYVPLQPAGFDDFLAYAAALGFEGASVTIPFKRDAIAAAHRTDALTARVGAANTLRRRARDGDGPRGDGAIPTGGGAAGAASWEAINTDVGGFLDPLERLYPADVRGTRAAVLGAGGAARAVVVALVSRGARVTVHARRPESARVVAEALGAGAGDWPPAPGSWDLLVNCTPLGGPGARDASPLPGGPFGGRLVYDLTYGPGESALVREAREAGCLVLDGLPMLVAQAERQFEWWTGVRPPAGVMRGAADARMAAPAEARG